MATTVSNSTFDSHSVRACVDLGTRTTTRPADRRDLARVSIAAAQPASGVWKVTRSSRGGPQTVAQDRVAREELRTSLVSFLTRKGGNATTVSMDTTKNH